MFGALPRLIRGATALYGVAGLGVAVVFLFWGLERIDHCFLAR